MTIKLTIENGFGNSDVRIIKHEGKEVAQAQRLEFGYSTDDFYQLVEIWGSDVMDQDLYFKNMDALLVCVREYIDMEQEFA